MKVKHFWYKSWGKCVAWVLLIIMMMATDWDVALLDYLGCITDVAVKSSKLGNHGQVKPSEA